MTVPTPLEALEVIKVPLGRHSSESSEHYTPSLLCEMARSVMGVIDLDPASCEEANRTVKARAFFSRAENGFTRAWNGRVFINPPGGLSDDEERLVKPKCRMTGSCGLPVPHEHRGVQASQKKWWFKLAREYAAGRVAEAIFVCFSIELLQNTQVDTPPGLSIPLDYAIGYPARRIPYVKPGGGVGDQPPHASCIIYLPGSHGNSDRFRGVFSKLGRVVVPS
jgi:hypothetical protein